MDGFGGGFGALALDRRQCPNFRRVHQGLGYFFGLAGTQHRLLGKLPQFVRIHQTLKVSPAMAAGVSDRLWECTTWCSC
jgi:hypothetical protein